MSEWITDREPTEADGNPHVWITTERGVVERHMWTMVYGRPWQPIVPPEPYVKPKRYKARYSTSICRWFIDGTNGSATVLDELNGNDDKHREAAERIAAIYEEMMP